MLRVYLTSTVEIKKDKYEEKRDEEIDDQPNGRGVAPQQPGEDRGDFPAVVPADRQNRPQLDRDRKGLVRFARARQPRLRHDQMPGGRDRQKFGRAFE